MQIRSATRNDAPGMSAMLMALIDAGKRTARGDIDFVIDSYIDPPTLIRCSVAVEADGSILGLQALLLADVGNRFDIPVGWGIIGTHVSPLAARRGIGSGLFAVTRQAAIDASLQNIEAFIATTNIEGQAYYEATGFRTYRVTNTSVCKRYRII